MELGDNIGIDLGNGISITAKTVACDGRQQPVTKCPKCGCGFWADGNDLCFSCRDKDDAAKARDRLYARIGAALVYAVTSHGEISVDVFDGDIVSAFGHRTVRRNFVTAKNPNDMVAAFADALETLVKEWKD